MVESNQTETNFLQPQSLLKAFCPTKTLNLLLEWTLFCFNLLTFHVI